MHHPKDFWDNKFRGVDLTTVDLSANRSEKLLDYFCDNFLEDKAKVLDLACGGGRNARFLAKQGYEVHAVDFSPAAVNFCRQSFDVLKLRANFYETEMKRLPFDAGVFSGAVCVAALDHLTLVDAFLTLNEMRRVLKPGGKIFITFDPIGTNEDVPEKPQILPDGTWRFNGGSKAGMLFREYPDDEIIELIGQNKVLHFNKDEDGTRRVIAR